MKRKPGLVFGALVLLVAAFAIVIVRQESACRGLKAELAIWQRQRAELARLRGENRDLSAARISSEELAQLRRTHAEADQLRLEIEALKQQPAVTPPGNPEENYSKPSLASEWKLAGRATPRAAFESVLWAATHQDIDHLAALLGFDAKTRVKAEAFFAQLPPETQAQYGSPEKIAATMLAANMPANLNAVAGLGESTQQDRSQLFMQLQRSDGTVKANAYTFQRGPDGWQLIVPGSVLQGYEKELTDGSVPVSQALSEGQKP